MICLQGHITKDVPVIFDAVFECTLDMINKVVILPCFVIIITLLHHIIFTKLCVCQFCYFILVSVQK